MYKKGAGNDKQGKDAGNRTLCPYRNFSQAIKHGITPLESVSLTNTSLVHTGSGAVVLSFEEPLH